MSSLSKEKRNRILVAALIIFVIALVWGIYLNSNDELAKVVRRINEFGYEFYSDDVYVLGSKKDTTISDVITEANAEADIDKIKELSIKCGFDAEMDKQGEVTILLLAIDENRVINIYMLDENISACFVENIVSGEISALG